MERQRQSQHEYNLRVEIHFTNGTHTELLTTEFDVNLDAIKSTTTPQRFTYKGVSGDEHRIYLTPAQVARIVVVETYH